MEVVGTLASVTAVVELSAKVLSLCVQYSVEVKDSERDIKRLQVEVLSLNGVLEKFKELLEGPDGTKLSASQEMDDTLDGCSLQLESLRKTLDPGKSRKVMSRMGLRALKWPFESKQVDKAIRVLERSKQTVSLALQVDQTRLIIDVHQKIDIAKLPSAEGAAFDSLREENEARCLQGTRTDLLRQIKEWADDPQGKCIFWLNGMAGTGKSTISRSIAQMFTDEGRLGASFFFKRGEMDRGTAAKFFTTIAVQLVTKVPRLIPYVRKAIEAEPTIAEKAMKEQFEKLILQPLCEIKHVSPLVVIIDALDECEPEDHIFNILHLLSQTRSKFKGSVKCLRIFVTSRPELPIRFGFNNMQGGIYQDLVLQDIPQSIIEHDISTFLSHEFAEIKKRHDGVRPEYRWLRSDWPGERNIRTLVQMATPLFIFAATVCRFIGDSTADPEARLATVLSYQKQNWESIDKTYIPILNQLLVNSELTDSEKENITKEFRNIVGPIIILADPLSTASLASLLNIPRNIIDYRLDSLHSVLSVHQDSPVRLLHLSFRDFLLDKKKREKNAFWVDERKTNEMVAIKCIERISIITSLRKNICNLESFEKLRTEIDSEVINKCLPADIQYACRYWVYHLKQSESRVCDQDRVHRFLQERFLYWLEALSLMGRMSESIALISTLQSLVTVAESTQVARFLEDAKRFVLRYRWIVDYAPLQLYASAIVFAPETSIIKNKFQDLIPDWISRLPIVESTWSTTLQILEGHANGVHAVAFSPDGRLVASGSFDETVRLWDVSTGAERATLSGHSGQVRAVAFSPDGRLIASGSNDKTVKLWDVSTGVERATLSGHSDQIYAVAFSPDGRLIASGSFDKTVKLWDVSTGAEHATLSSHSHWIRAVAFSSDGRLIASGSEDTTVKLWDVSTGVERATLSGHWGPVYAVAFSPDGRLVASGSFDNTVMLWDVSTGAKRATLSGHSSPVHAVAFSPDGRLVASGSVDKTVRLWDAKTMETTRIIETEQPIRNLSFSHDGSYIQTEHGPLYISQPPTGQPLHSSSYFYVQKHWLAWGTKNILWLPSDYRPTDGGSVAVRGDTVAIGHASGRVSFFEFDLTKL